MAKGDGQIIGLCIFAGVTGLFAIALVFYWLCYARKKLKQNMAKKERSLPLGRVESAGFHRGSAIEERLTPDGQTEEDEAKHSNITQETGLKVAKNITATAHPSDYNNDYNNATDPQSEESHNRSFTIPSEVRDFDKNANLVDSSNKYEDMKSADGLSPVYSTVVDVRQEDASSDWGGASSMKRFNPERRSTGMISSLINIYQPNNASEKTSKPRPHSSLERKRPSSLTFIPEISQNPSYQDDEHVYAKVDTNKKSARKPKTVSFKDVNDNEQVMPSPPPPLPPPPPPPPPPLPIPATT